MSGFTYVSGTATPEKNMSRCTACGKFLDRNLKWCVDCLNDLHIALTVANIDLSKRHPAVDRFGPGGIDDYTK
jgi:hypothetical protein